jgi:predicted nucleic acid-binding protein
MVLVDTSVWIAHFRKGSLDLMHLLESGQVVGHPFVIGELACGNLHRRAEIIRLLSTLPSCPIASHEEVLRLVESWHLMGTGLGYIDVHLLASAMIGGVRLWTLDRKLQQAALTLGVAHEDFV